MASYRRSKHGWEAQVARMGVRKSKTFDTKAEAAAWAADTEASIKEHFDLKKRFSQHPKSKVLLNLDKIVRLAKPLPNSPGIYFLINKGTIAYIGKSKNVLSRLAAHESNGRDFTDYTFIPCALEYLDDMEMAYISAFKPSGNKLIQEKFPVNYATEALKASL